MKTLLLILPACAAILFMTSCVSPLLSSPLNGSNRPHVDSQAAQDEANTEIMVETQNMINAQSAAATSAQP